MNQTLTHALDLLWEMTLKELRLRYKNTTLGFLWVIIYPVIQAVIIGYIFQYVYNVTDPNYQYTLFLNLLLWNFFASSLENATPSIVRSRSIIKKARFAYSVIPLSIVLCNAIHLAFSLTLFSTVALLTHISNGIQIMFMIPAFILLVLFTGSLTLITSALHVRSRDVSFLTRAFLMVWFYATPIIYSAAGIPQNIAYAWHLNPLTEIVMFFQYATFHTAIIPPYIISNSMLIICFIALGIALFRRQEEYFDDYL